MSVRRVGYSFKSWVRMAAWLSGYWLCSAIGSEFRDEPIRVLKPVDGLDPEKVALGHALYTDTRLSADNSISCNHCHRLASGGMDRMPVSIGIRGQKGSINAPTVYNLAGQVSYFWDGRASSLADQVEGPIHNPVEMASNWAEVIDKLQQDQNLVERFEKLYPQGIDATSISDALADFLLSLVTLDSPMDRWLKGDDKALTDQQLRGYRLFKSYGCIACHQGKNVGGNLFATMGVMGDYFAERGTPETKADQGRFNVTGKEEDRHVFKVPSLRLAALTPPYFHDGSVDTLEKAVETMGYFQLGRRLGRTEIEDIVAFLHSLIGTHPLLTEQK